LKGAWEAQREDEVVERIIELERALPPQVIEKVRRRRNGPCSRPRRRTGPEYVAAFRMTRPQPGFLFCSDAARSTGRQINHGWTRINTDGHFSVAQQASFEPQRTQSNTEFFLKIFSVFSVSSVVQMPAAPFKALHPCLSASIRG